MYKLMLLLVATMMVISCDNETPTNNDAKESIAYGSVEQGDDNETSSTNPSTNTNDNNSMGSTSTDSEDGNTSGTNNSDDSNAENSSAVSVSSITYYSPTSKDNKDKQMEVLVGTWKNDEVTLNLYQSGLAKETIKKDGSTPQKSYSGWAVKGEDKQLCLIQSSDGVENCYDMLVINQKELQLNMYDKKITLQKQ